MAFRSWYSDAELGRQQPGKDAQKAAAASPTVTELLQPSDFA